MTDTALPALWLAVTLLAPFKNVLKQNFTGLDIFW